MSTDDPYDLEGEFWERVTAYESQTPRPLFDVLIEAGVPLPAPEELDDEQIGPQLWKLIHALALLGTFLHNTDHLSDRELYTELWREELREAIVLMPDEPTFSSHIDLVGSGSEEHLNLYLKYYADEEERRSWRKEWPDDPIPEHAAPPYDRDRLLPRSENGLDGKVM